MRVLSLTAGKRIIRWRNAARYADSADFMPWDHAGLHLSGSATAKLPSGIIAAEDQRRISESSAGTVLSLARSSFVIELT
jgi:hypothetical protein